MEFVYLYEPPAVTTAITQAIGAASLCWREIDKNGQYDVEQALEIAAATSGEVRRIITFRLCQLLEPTGAAAEWNDAIETAIRMIEEMP